jgi:hypothetical protein
MNIPISPLQKPAKMLFLPDQPRNVSRQVVVTKQLRQKKMKQSLKLMRDLNFKQVFQDTKKVALERHLCTQGDTVRI